MSNYEVTWQGIQHNLEKNFSHEYTMFHEIYRTQTRPSPFHKISRTQNRSSPFHKIYRTQNRSSPFHKIYRTQNRSSPFHKIYRTQLQSSAVIMWPNLVRYYINNHRNWSRIWIRCWIHKRQPIPCPNGQGMGCLLWIFVKKLTSS